MSGASGGSQVWSALERLGIPAPDCRRVLLVDDQPENLLVLEALLQDDWDVLTAESGVEALALLEEHQGTDLVISDQRMPGMTGVELLAVVAERWPETVRIVLTGFSDVEPIVSAVNRGSVYRFLLKPWNPVEMQTVVKDAMRLKGTRFGLRRVVEALVERRTSLLKTLDETKRVQDQLLAAERLSTLGRLTSGITHDIRNQLSVMLSLVDIVREKTQDPVALGAAQDALATVQSLYYLLKDVNAFAKSQPIDVQPRIVPIRAFIDDTLNLLRLDPAWREPRVTIDVAPEAAEVRVDGHRLRQALFALLRNAMQAAPDVARVEIRVRREGGLTCVEVQDHGCGMEPDVLAQAATPFFSAFDPPGVGLGLGIVTLVATAHEGRVEIDSVAQRGTTVRLWLGTPRVEGVLS